MTDSLFLVGIDDTDVLGAAMGTGKLVRLLAERLPPVWRMVGVVRHQLLVHPDVPFTSHNSPACAVVERADPAAADPQDLVQRAHAHVLALCSEGSDPGVCVAPWSGVSEALMHFGRRCGRDVVTQAEAYAAAGDLSLHGLGGTDDGVIGAAAAVGLTRWGYAGRFIEYGELRALPETVSVAELEALGIEVVSMAHDAPPLTRECRILARGKVRPRLIAGRPILPVRPGPDGVWRLLAYGRAEDPFVVG